MCSPMPKFTSPAAAKKPAAGFAKPVQPDEALAAVVGSTPLPRTELTKKLWEYIRTHKLQDPAKKTQINADEKLKAVFDGRAQVTPVDGIAMCTRSGAVDPGILIYLLRQGATADELEKMLNKRSGLAGLSGMAGDTRVIVPEMNKGNARARLAFDVFIHRLRAGIGAMLASLGGLDALVFTDGISEDEPAVRAAVCEPFKFLGLTLDQDKNASSPLDADIATAASRVRVLIVKSQENWQIARECFLIAPAAV